MIEAISHSDISPEKAFTPNFHSQQWNVYEELNQTSIEKDISEPSQKHLERDDFFCDVFKAFQTHLKKDVFFVTFLRSLRNISKKMSFVWRL